MNIRDLMPVAMIMVVSIIALSIGAEVVNSVRDDQVTGAAGCNATSRVACGYAYNASESGLAGMAEVGDWYPTIGLVIAASIVIGVLVYSFAMRS